MAPILQELLFPVEEEAELSGGAGASYGLRRDLPDCMYDTSLSFRLGYSSGSQGIISYTDTIYSSSGLNYYITGIDHWVIKEESKTS